MGSILLFFCQRYDKTVDIASVSNFSGSCSKKDGSGTNKKKLMEPIDRVPRESLLIMIDHAICLYECHIIGACGQDMKL